MIYPNTDNLITLFLRRQTRILKIYHQDKVDIHFEHYPTKVITL